jgi:endonuclease YncB( thermonuclease family)
VDGSSLAPGRASELPGLGSARSPHVPRPIAFRAPLPASPRPGRACFRAAGARGLAGATLLTLCALVPFARAGAPDAPVLPHGVLEGHVVAVLDGDTLEIVSGRERRRIRLAGIDTPERGQPWAERSRRALAARVFGKDVRVNDLGLDRWERTVGEVYADGVCVGCELVREGHAWVYREFSQDPVLLGLEAEARAARRGLWSLPEAQRVPPWEWRHRTARERAPPPAAQGACVAKRSCSEMASCAEARAFAARCGAQHLDADGDGVPCESLCGAGHP